RGASEPAGDHYVVGELTERLPSEAGEPVVRPTGVAALHARAAAIGTGLAAVGLAGDAVTATLLATRIELRTGGYPPLPRLPPVERMANRLLARLVRHEVRSKRDAVTASTAELKAGLRELHQHRTRFGSLDLASAVALHGQELVRLGLRSAVADGRPSVVHDWVERTRAASLRLTPVRPPKDQQAAAALAELRAVRAAQRAAELSGSAAMALDARRTHLERAVRQRAWFVSGAATGPDRLRRLGEVRNALGDGCLVSYLVVDGTITALVTTARAARVVPLASSDALLGDLRRVRADLDAAALAVLPAPLRASVLGSLAAGLVRLDATVWRPLARWTGDGPVVIVPTGSLAAVPWTLLAGLRGRPVTVAPSATWWMAHRRPTRSGNARTVVAAGPGLRRAAEEATAVARQWPSSTTLLGPAATAEAVLARAGTAGVLHLAAHGRHEPDNPLFSSVELADGPLFGHDLPRAAALPPHVVLSACDLALVVERPGDESLGMTSALLHGGVSSVVAGVARVNDDIACRLMIAYHGALRAGRTPSAALAAALAVTGSDHPERPAPFTVIGAGW
ncbi:MAG: CHAT domain-containing protein, partial [Pseudonocardia sp.]|nr:CHAT domain-containing protein [Pseudonocardia sp.]